MGNLRIEPKVKAFDSDRYNEIKEILMQARLASQDSNIFWDLEKKEDGARVRREFKYVAEEEGIDLMVRRQRGTNTLKLTFSGENVRRRMSAEEGRDRILTAMKQHNGPMKKSEILKATNISPATWNLRIRELINMKQVVRKGTRRDTIYNLK